MNRRERYWRRKREKKKRDIAKFFLLPTSISRLPFLELGLPFLDFHFSNSFFFLLPSSFCQLSSGQLSSGQAVNCQAVNLFAVKRSTVNCQLLSYHRSTVNCQLSTVNCQLSTVNCQLSTVLPFS
ncbi:hypothetical protein Q5689_31950 [Microcoleus sp. ARI1-A2]|uniref:hypothetical protein n=1 Tax=Microcoleus sp. ARI1-A2 TaxID=2818557 RepID=UPI002FCEBEA7